MDAPQIAKIAAMEDPVLRNLWITQAYHDLGTRLSGAGLGGDSSWLLFAVWASKTAGSTIRGDEIPRRLRELLQGSSRLPALAGLVNRCWWGLRLLGLAEPLTVEHLLEVFDQVAADVSRRIADGNRLVFAELAPIFAALSSGSRPPPCAPELQGAVDSYLAALQAAPGEARAVAVLGANVAAVAHEQHRLQRDILGALDAPVAEGIRRLIDEELVRRLPGRLARALAWLAVEALCREAERIWRLAVTAAMMRLVTADEELDLHESLPPLPGEPMFPPELSGPLAEEALGPWDRTAGTGKDCAVDDWASLEQRMNYIVNMFRSRQQHLPLACPPFSPGQLASLKAGRVPDPPL